MVLYFNLRFIRSSVFFYISGMKTSILLLCLSSSLFGQEPHLSSGLEHIGKGQYKEAIADFTNFIKINPDYAAAYINRGVAYYEIKEYELALNDYNSAHETLKMIKHIQIEVTNTELGNYDDAIEDCSKAIEINPNNAKAYYNSVKHMAEKEKK